MNTVIGQAKLLKYLSQFSVSTLPKTMLFFGPKGCGKHFIAQKLANRLGLDFSIISDEVTQDSLTDMLHSTIKTLYVIDLDTFLEKQQNMFLKFIEEPSETVFVVLTATSSAAVLPTILNRCIKCQFEDYSVEELSKILNMPVDTTAVKIFKTPGKLQGLTTVSFNNTINLANSILNNIYSKNTTALLLTQTAVNFKDLYDKVDFTLLLDAIVYIAFEDFVQNNNLIGLSVFNITNRFSASATNTKFNKEMLMSNYLITLFEEVNT